MIRALTTEGGRRGRSSCQSCRRRGKKCDETRPVCSTCQRLQLECSYSVGYAFRVVSAPATDREMTSLRGNSSQATPRQLCKTTSCCPLSKWDKELDPGITLPRTIRLQNNDAAYMAHFGHSVCVNLLGQLQCLAGMLVWNPCVRYAVLSISASHLATLQGSNLRHYSKRSPKRCYTDSAIHRIHHRQSVRYAQISERYLDGCDSATDVKDQITAAVFAKVLLALYYHMAIDHLQFKRTVSKTLNLVRDNYPILRNSPNGEMVLRYWYRLHLSCRPSKPPALPLDGEEICGLFPTFTPSSLDDQIDLECNLRLSVDDLIYSILIKIIELRSRIITVRCATANETASNPYIKSDDVDDQFPKVALNGRNGKGPSGSISKVTTSDMAIKSHLFDLVYIQERRLKLWKDMVRLSEHEDRSTICQRPGHRQSMNLLYSLLCELIIVELRKADGTFINPSGFTTNEYTASLLGTFFSIADSLDYTQSNLQDTYTFSLTETLRQLVYSWPSQSVFEHILNIIWPKIEHSGPGFEHSHLPTALAKRYIKYSMNEYDAGRHVVLTSSLMPEDTAKGTYLDCDSVVRIMVYTAARHDGTALQSVQARPVSLPCSS